MFNLEILRFELAGITNWVTLFFGITVAFLDSRYNVFKKKYNNILNHALNLKAHTL